MIFDNGTNVGINETSPNAKLDVAGGINSRNTRVDATKKYPIGHYAPGETVFELDPTWTQAQMQDYMGSTAFTWNTDATAPGGYCIQVDGAVNVGNVVYSSGFPFIPTDTGSNDWYYMECWIRNEAGSVNNHYMGGIDYNESFASLGGNPGSYTYNVMLNYDPGTSWTKVFGYWNGFGDGAGGAGTGNTNNWEVGTKYFGPQALFNYINTSGTVRCYISGWKVIRVSQQGNRYFQNNVLVNGNVGIGTTSPSGPLNIYRSQAGAGSTSLYIDNRDTTAGQTNSTIISTQHLGSGIARTIINAASYTAGNKTRGEFGIITENGAQFVANIGTQMSGGENAFSLYTTTGIEGVRLNSGGTSWINGGNVGIGTISPSTRLHVSGGNSTLHGVIVGDDVTYGSPYKTIAFGSTGDGNNRILGATTTADGLYFMAATGQGFSFRANGGTTNNVVINSSGNVGIGTTTPSAKLQIIGATDSLVLDADSSGFNGRHVLLPGRTVVGTIGNSYPEIGYNFVTSGGVYTKIANDTAWGIGLGGSNYMSFKYAAAGTGTFSWNTAAVINLSGNVGIGTTNPVSKLEVVGDIATNGGNVRVNVGISTGDAYVDIGPNRSGNGYSYIDLIGDTTYTDYGLRLIRGNSGANTNSQIIHRGTGPLEIGTFDSATLGLFTNGGTKVTILSDGNVGIGTTSPKGALNIVGGSLADGGAGMMFSSQLTTGRTGTFDASSVGSIHTYLDAATIELAAGSSSGWISGISVTGNNATINKGTVRFLTVSAERMRINSDGNIGINETSPVGKLTISNSASGASDLIFQRWKYIPSSDAYRLDLKQTVTDGVVRYNFSMLNNGTAYNNVLVLDRGRVGIGTTEPAHKLTIEADQQNLKLQSSTDPANYYAEISANYNYANAFTINANGAGGVQTLMLWGDGVGLTLQGGASRPLLLQPSNGNVGIGTTSASYKLDVTGTIRATGDVIAYSDARVKDNVKTIENALEKITSLRGVSYTRKDTDDKSPKIGVIAQEVLPIIPEVVSKDQHGNYSVSYGNIVGLLIEAVKEQQKQIDELKYLLKNNKNGN
jgi:hypothetical protein